ncbi:MAG: TetR family transcriptional regulator [Planctomycetia bacterium]|nr:TetR family transcriptional regulator [Planctomycetia bacterium]
MSRGPDAPTSDRAQRREATRAALVAAAHALAARGADPLDPAAVAREAGVSRPLWYAHFPTRLAFVDALFASVPAPASPAAAGAPAATPARPGPGSPAAALRRFFVGLATPLDAHAALARVLIPASHVPGPVATARAARRAVAVARLAALLPAGLASRRRRATFLMDAFLGLQLAWCREPAGPSLVARVRNDLEFAIRGVLAPATPSSAPRTRRSLP